jgi:pimeloyl-ACP methyl ester carboxylesterase
MGAGMQAEDLTLDGRRVRLWRGGDGPALLLLHGGMTDAESHWDRIWDRLTPHFTVIAPDWPGFGGSQPLRRPTYPRLVAWMDRLRSALGVERMSLAGNSFGGTLGRLYAIEHPDRVERLMALNGGGLIPRLPLVPRLILASPLGARDMARRAKAGMGRAALARMMADVDAYDPQAVARFAASGEIFPVLRHCLTGPAPQGGWADVPTLLLWGEADRHVPVAAGQALAAEAPHLVLRTIAGAGHFPQLEQPQATTDAMLDFAGIGRGAA